MPSVLGTPGTGLTDSLLTHAAQVFSEQAGSQITQKQQGSSSARRGSPTAVSTGAVVASALALSGSATTKDAMASRHQKLSTTLGSPSSQAQEALVSDTVVQDQMTTWLKQRGIAFPLIDDKDQQQANDFENYKKMSAALKNYLHQECDVAKREQLQGQAVLLLKDTRKVLLLRYHPNKD